MGTIAENQAAAESRFAALEARVSALESEQAVDLEAKEAAPSFTPPPAPPAAEE